MDVELRRQTGVLSVTPHRQAPIDIVTGTKMMTAKVFDDNSHVAGLTWIFPLI